MSGITCEQAAANIDLLAAEACDGPTGVETSTHLASCPACEMKYRQARELMGLLDLRMREPESLQKLWRSVRPAAKRRPSDVLAFPRRVAALAAMLLLALGLSLGLPPSGGTTGPDLRASLALPEAEFGFPEHAFVRSGPQELAGPAAKDATARSEYVLNDGGLSSAEFRRAVTGGRVPPPEVQLSLYLHNDGDRPMRIDLDDERASLTLDVRGPSVASVAAPPEAEAPLHGVGAVPLAPGGSKRLTIDRLADGVRGAVRYQYWTAPGDYTVTAEVRAPVETDPLVGRRMRTFSTGPLRIHVAAK
jgi:hypothetical protein